MKTSFIAKITPLVFALFVSLAAFAGGNEAFTASVKLNDESNVTISLIGDSPNTIEIKVFGNTGEMVTYKRLINSGTRIFNHKLSVLPNGIYTYQVVEGSELVYSARILKFDDYSAECHNTPSGAIASISKLNDEQVIVRLAGDKEGKSKIRVTDEFGNQLFRRTVKNVESAKFTYDISKFPEGRYNFKVYNGNELIAYRKVTK